MREVNSGERKKERRKLLMIFSATSRSKFQHHLMSVINVSEKDSSVFRLAGCRGCDSRKSPPTKLKIDFNSKNLILFVNTEY